MAETTILFICTGNTCRSPLARVLAEEALSGAGLTGWPIRSAGLSAFPGMPASEEARAVAREAGLDLSSHSASPLSEELLAEAGLVLVMTEGHKRALTAAAPAYADKIHTLKEFVGREGDVSDPFGRGAAYYRKTADELHELICLLVEKIKE